MFSQSWHYPRWSTSNAINWATGRKSHLSEGWTKGHVLGGSCYAVNGDYEDDSSPPLYLPPPPTTASPSTPPPAVYFGPLFTSGRSPSLPGSSSLAEDIWSSFSSHCRATHHLNGCFTHLEVNYIITYFSILCMSLKKKKKVFTMSLLKKSLNKTFLIVTLCSSKIIFANTLLFQ